MSTRRYAVGALVLALFTIGPAVAAEDAGAMLTGLKPGVSSVDAFMAREPSPPISGEEAVQMQSLVEELSKRLDVEDTVLGNRANKLEAQSIPADMQGGGENPPSAGQAMAIAQQMRSGGGMQAMMMMTQFITDGHHQAHVNLWRQRMREAEDALQSADGWLETAKEKLVDGFQSSRNNCPTRRLGELTEPDPVCIRSVALAYQQKMHHLAAVYLNKVSDPLDHALAATKVLVDEQEAFAKKMAAAGKGAMVQGRVVGLEGMSIRRIKTYNDRLLRAVDAACDLATFRVDPGT